MRHIVGGIGDILLSLEDALKENEIEVFSHYRNAPEIYEPFDIAIHYQHFQDLKKIHPRGRALPLQPYPVFEMPSSSVMKTRSLRLKERVIGIHPLGSRFSNKVMSRRRLPVKKIPEKFLLKIIEELDDASTTFLVFVAPSDRTRVRIRQKGVVIVAEKNIWDAFAHVCVCNYIIAVDSAIKTMSALRKIPTVVLLGDYSDPYRDRHFIDPYVGDGVMKVIRYRRLSEFHVRQVCSAVRTWSSKP